MKLRITLIILAIILGALAVFGVIGYINSIKATVEEEVEKVEVLVAEQNIPKEVPVETLIEENLVMLKSIPRKYLAEGVLTSLDGYTGYVVANHISKGEQITTTMFAKPEDLGLSFVIPDGMVAISIPIDEVIGVSYLINAGDRVNIIATFPGVVKTESSGEVASEETTGEETQQAEGLVTGEGELTPITKTILWNVEVLHIGIRKAGTQSTDETNYGDIGTITLAVTPEDSEKVVFIEENTSVWLALVPVDGIEEGKTPGISFDNVSN
jgi:pilus assembly protein CpaB